jgi:UDP-N-acetylglucosamine acyltransferase
MTNEIHQTAIIDPTVKMGQGNKIGPYCILKGDIELGDNNELKSHVIMESSGKITIGNNNIFFPFVSLNIPQDKKFHGEYSELIMGDENVFREYSTANSGTEAGVSITKIGNRCLFLINSHIAHDCIIGDDIVLSNNVAIAGHVIIDDFAIVSGQSAVLQRTKIGKHSIIGGMSAVAGDVIPYGVVLGDRAHLSGINLVGLKRRGFSREVMLNIKKAYDIAFDASDINFAERIENILKSEDLCLEARNMLEFILDNTKQSRSLCKPR